MAEAFPVDVIAWSMLHQSFPYPGERLLSVTPWGRDKAVIVTDFAVYIAEPDELFGFTMRPEIRR